MSLIKLLFYLAILFPAQAKIDDSVEIFFPPGLQYLHFSQTEFSFFWWNFVVVYPKDGQPDFEKASALCKDLDNASDFVRRKICGDDIHSFMPALRSWAGDYLRRVPLDLEKIVAGLKNAQGELAMMSSSNTELLQLKRLDPFDQWQDYLARTQKLMSNNFVRERGFLLDPKSKRLVIPLQLSKPPKKANADAVMSIVMKLDALMVGSHAGAYANEKQVTEDLSVVSLVGAVVLLLFIGLLVAKGRWGALFLLPPLAFSMLIAAGITHLIYGSIHGLTLAFGTGIVGLGLDYGLHGAFNSESKQIWKSNLTGLLTTIAGLAALLKSSIPLLQQMMVFAILGISLCFISYYICCNKWPRVFTFKSLHMRPPDFRYGLVVVSLLTAIGVSGASQLKFDFDIGKFNYQTPKQKEANDWFFTMSSARENILLLEPKEKLDETFSHSRWAESNRISYLGIGTYLPRLSLQESHMQTWFKGCPTLFSQLQGPTAVAFDPFIKATCGASRNPTDFLQRDYIIDLVGSKHILSVFMTKTPEEEDLVRQTFPESRALIESLRDFSSAMKKDMTWILPAALILASLILFLYYRRFIYVIAAFVPFFTGVGLFFAGQIVFGGHIDLISVLGLLMVFGFSLDYGVFAADIHAFPQSKDIADDVHSALCLAAMSNIVGFFPMLFAKHAMLHQLGVALFLGTIGTYIGTIWGVGPVIKQFGKRNA